MYFLSSLKMVYFYLSTILVMYQYFYSAIYLRLWSLHAYLKMFYPSTWLDRERE